MEGKIRSLRVQATQTVDLAFNMPGIISHHNFDQNRRQGPAFLGERVKAFDFQQVYGKLGDTVRDESTGAVRLRFRSAEIRQLMSGGAHWPFLYALRNEGLGASLDQMIARREAAVLDRFMHHQGIKALMESVVPDTIESLDSMRSAIIQRSEEIQQAYEKDGKIGVEKSSTILTRIPTQETESNSESLPIAMVSTRFDGEQPQPGKISTEILEGSGTNVAQTHQSDRTASVPMTRRGDGWATPDGFFASQHAVSRTSSTDDQRMVTPYQAYMHPILDNVIASRQQRVAVNEEKLRNEVLALKLPHMERILARELQSMDLEIRALQVNFAHTYLMPPIDGIVTAIYKDVGESVEPGEPVIRIENDSFVMLFGRIQFKEPLWPGRKVNVNIGSVFETTKDEALECKIVSVRGHESDDDEWEVILEAKNPDAGDGRPLLPINYQLDPDTATIELA
ncbi:MAG: hypothetical protein OXN89_03270 [Bryobacterales bacterium]|nr:hypothetical protein [Bryobacterales bacterium]